MHARLWATISIGGAPVATPRPRSPQQWRGSAPPAAESADPHQCTAIDRQRHAGDEISFVRSEKQRCISDVPCRSHPAAQRNLGIALRSDLGAAAVAGPSTRVDGHWRIHESWQDAVGANAVWSVLQSQLLAAMAATWASVWVRALLAYG